MGRCRHGVELKEPWDNIHSRTVTFYDKDGNETERRLCRVFVCWHCGEWESIGPSNDSDERVRVEIAAAELASWSNNADEPVLAWVGRRHFIEGHEMPTTATALAGWLAAAIATHPNRDEGDL